MGRSTYRNAQLGLAWLNLCANVPCPTDRPLPQDVGGRGHGRRHRELEGGLGNQTLAGRGGITERYEVTWLLRELFGGTKR